ncbi:MAG: CpsD/CapB family tyrosine-protein kinase [Bilifractor sp.]|nr:CpsD/CapB family tyrosine-protein kinase [Lachnospiraceae bacterium]MDY2838209.1 CpsD/CapB family tyrosine-protein kinase [Bilifractor sp.]
MLTAQRIINIKDPDPGDYFYRESIKTLRANIQFSGRKNRVIMFTSCFQAEGKSDTTFHLSVEMAKLGKKVLLIDSDIRNSQFAQRYGITSKVNGLTEYLSGQVQDANEILYQTNYAGLYLTMAGAYAPNPSEMLADEQFRNYVKAASSVFDYIFIDTPPLGQIIDAAQIGQICDGAVLVIMSGGVYYRAAQKVCEQLRQADIHILGVVLNRVDRSGSSAYGKYGRYGKYGKYGKYGRYGEYGHEREEENT